MKNADRNVITQALRNIKLVPHYTAEWVNVCDSMFQDSDVIYDMPTSASLLFPPTNQKALV